MSSSEISSLRAFSRCLVTTVRRRRSLVRRSRLRTHPTVRRDSSPANRTLRREEDVAEGHLGRERNRQQDEGHASRTAPVVPSRPRNASPRRPADDPSRFGVFPVEPAAPQGERHEHRDREDEKTEPGGLRAGIGKRLLPETPPPEEKHERRHAPGRQAEQRVQRRGERRPEAPDPVVRVGSPSPGRPGKNVGVVRIERETARAAPAPRRASAVCRSPRSPADRARRSLHSSVVHYRTETSKGPARRRSQARDRIVRGP